MNVFFDGVNKGCNSGEWYPDWRRTRIQKLVTVLGEGWFIHKKILELGCGYGHTGIYLRDELGADVTFADGNLLHMQETQRRVGNSKVLLLDQDKPWSFDHKFDLIIHWGVLYHLVNWKQDLINAIKHSRILALESEVVDSHILETEVVVNETWTDGSIHNLGIRMTTDAIQTILTNNHMLFKRYDDTDLNSAIYKYDWVPGSRDHWNGTRRFWIAYHQNTQIF